MKKKLLNLAAAVCLLAPSLAFSQSIATPAGTDATGTNEVGIQTTGTREMATGASGTSGVVGRGVGQPTATVDTNRETAAADSAGAPTDKPAPATIKRKRHKARTTTTYR